MLLFLAACIYRRAIPFHQDEMMKDSLFFSKIAEIAKEKGIIPGNNVKQEGELKYYKLSFHERQIENGNVVDYSNVSNDTLAVPYNVRSAGTYQELYLVNVPMSDTTDNLYVYYSLNYNADKEIVGFGPAYLGQLVPCPNNKKMQQIEFFVSLESKRKKPFVLEKTKDATDIKFVLRKFNQDTIAVSKIVEAMPNKIGGTRPLVFNTDSILGNNKLEFTGIK
jgi:hypothetical protein